MNRTQYRQIKQALDQIAAIVQTSPSPGELETEVSLSLLGAFRAIGLPDTDTPRRNDDPDLRRRRFKQEDWEFAEDYMRWLGHGQRALDGFLANGGESESGDFTNLADLVTDILHLADHNGFKPVAIVRQALDHWHDERPPSAKEDD